MGRKRQTTLDSNTSSYDNNAVRRQSHNPSAHVGTCDPESHPQSQPSASNNGATSSQAQSAMQGSDSTGSQPPASSSSDAQRMPQTLEELQSAVLKEVSPFKPTRDNPGVSAIQGFYYQNLAALAILLTLDPIARLNLECAEDMDITTLKKVAASSSEDHPLLVNSYQLKHVQASATLRESNVFKSIVHAARDLRKCQEAATLTNYKLAADDYHVTYMSSQQLAPGGEKSPKPFSGSGIQLWTRLQKKGCQLSASDPELIQLRHFLLNHIQAHYGKETVAATQLTDQQMVSSEAESSKMAQDRDNVQRLTKDCGVSEHEASDSPAMQKKASPESSKTKEWTAELQRFRKWVKDGKNMKLFILNLHWVLGHGSIQDLTERVEKLLAKRRGKLEPALFEYLAGLVWRTVICDEDDKRQLSAKDLSNTFEAYDKNVLDSLPPLVLKMLKIQQSRTEQFGREYNEWAVTVAQQALDILQEDFPNVSHALKARVVAGIFGNGLSAYKP